MGCGGSKEEKENVESNTGGVLSQGPPASHKINAASAAFQASPPGIHKVAEAVPTGTSRAVSLRFLLDFASLVEQDVGAEHWPALSSGEVCAKYIVPRTKELACAFVELPQVPRQHVGHLHYFISHAWRTPYSETVEMVRSYLAAAVAEETYVWMDIFAINQHAISTGDNLTILQDCVRLSRGMLVCLGASGAHLSRVWCLYELEVGLEKGDNTLQLLAAGLDRRQLREAVTSLDVAQADAFVASDKTMILNDITQRLGGLEIFNTAIKLRFLLEPLDYERELADALEALPPSSAGVGDAVPEAFQQWLQLQEGQPGHRMLAIVGGPGTGKSTVTASLIKAGCISAFHMCKYSDLRTGNALQALKTLTYQLAKHLADLARHCCGLSLPQVQDEVDVGEACSMLLASGLGALAEPPPGGLVLLIDALDEVEGARLTDNRILALLTAHLAQLPPWVRFVVSSRPDADLLASLRATLAPLELAPGAFVPEGAVLAPLRGLLGARLPEAQAEAALKLVEERSQGSLLYLRVVEQLLRSTPEGSEEQWLASLPQGLGAAYRCYLDDDRGSGHSKLAPNAVKPLLQVLCAAREPQNLAQLQRYGLEGVEGGLLPRLGLLFRVREFCVTALHRSVFEFLTDPGAAGPWHVVLEEAHAALAAMLLPELPRVEPGAGAGGAPKPSRYALRHTPAHLALAACWEQLDSLLCSLTYWGLVYQAGEGGGVVEDLTLLAQGHGSVVPEVLRWLQRDTRVLHNYPATLPQLAQDCPSSSLVAKLAAEQRPQPAPLVRLLTKQAAWPPEIMALVGHNQPVRSVCFSADGVLLMSASDDQSVRLWDARTGQQVASLHGESPAAMSADGAWVASKDVGLTLWDVKTGRQVFQIERRQPDVYMAVTCVAFSPDSTLVAIGVHEGAVDAGEHWPQLWDVRTGQPVGEPMPGHKGQLCAVAFSPTAPLLVSAAMDRTVRLWDLNTYKQVAVLEGHTGTIQDVTFSPDGALLASSSKDGTVRCYRTDDLEQCTVLAVPGASEAFAVAFSPDCRVLACCTTDGTALLWGVATGSLLVSLSVITDLLLDLTFSPNGELLALGGFDGVVRLWDVKAAQQLTAPPEGHTKHVAAIALSPDAQLTASASYDGTVRLWNTADGSPAGVMEGHTAGAFQVNFSPDGQLLSSVGWDSCLRVWDVAGRRQQAVMDMPCYAQAFSIDGEVVATGNDDNIVRLWNARTGQVLGALTGHKASISVIAFCQGPQSNILVTGSCMDNSARLWDWTTHQQLQQLPSPAERKMFTSLALSPDGSMLATSYDDYQFDCMVVLWSIGSWEQLVQLQAARLPGSSINPFLRMGPMPEAESLRFSDDGSWMLVGSRDRTVRMWPCAAWEKSGATGTAAAALEAEPGDQEPAAAAPAAEATADGADGSPAPSAANAGDSTAPGAVLSSWPAVALPDCTNARFAGRWLLAMTGDGLVKVFDTADSRSAVPAGVVAPVVPLDALACSGRHLVGRSNQTCLFYELMLGGS